MICFFFFAVAISATVNGLMQTIVNIPTSGDSVDKSQAQNLIDVLGKTAAAPVADRVLSRSDARQNYVSHLASSRQDIQDAQKLRFDVFNVELQEGLASSFATGLDADPYDAVCDHLIVRLTSTQEVVGTYRLQSGEKAAQGLGYYSAQEFDFSVYEPYRHEIVELGRACVAAQHRNLVVLSILWKGISDYTRNKGGKYLIGCSSLSSQEAAVGAAAYEILKPNHLASAPYQTHPLPALACPMEVKASSAPKIPKLLMAYLSIGAKICGPPAIDREFKTIDFLTLMDLSTISPLIVQRYLS
jgi:putative hemolysin